MSKRYAAAHRVQSKVRPVCLTPERITCAFPVPDGLGGVVIAKIEAISLGDGIYFAFITGLTIGYGDIVPATTWGRILSVAVGLIGTLFAGLIVAIASRALHDTIEQPARMITNRTQEAFAANRQAA